MTDRNLVEQKGWIQGDDIVVDIPTCTNMSYPEYFGKIAEVMTAAGTDPNSITKPSVYTFTTHDGDDGPYFTVQKIETSTNSLDQLCTYQIDVGAQTSNVVTNFSFKDQGGWSIYYNYA